MIEVVFGSSAKGSLMQATHFGKGPFHGSVGIVFGQSEVAEQADLERAQREAMERARAQWENAVPLEVKSTDIFCLEFALSIGDISEADFWRGRRETFERLHSVWPREDGEDRIASQLQKCREALESVCSRASAGESIRVWYSHNPDELCALYWLMSKLSQHDTCGEVYAVKIPEWESRPDGSVVWRMSCGELGRGDWGRFAPEQKLLSKAFIAGCAAHWQTLAEENAPLRAVLNSQLVSAAEDIYDIFIRRETASCEGSFNESHIIGRVLTKYRLGLGDAWLHFRIEEMLRNGELEEVTKAPEDGPVYRRLLRKRA